MNSGRREHVAPYVGAWIETAQPHLLLHILQVAPYVGAWIETVGLRDRHHRQRVAPYVGAWIETAFRTSDAARS